MSSRLLLLPMGASTVKYCARFLSSSEPLDDWQNLKHEECDSHRQRPDLDSQGQISDSTQWTGLQKRNYHFEPQVLQVCKQLHREGTNVLYNDNALVIHVLDDGRTDQLHVEALRHGQCYSRNERRSIMYDEPESIEEWVLGTERIMKNFVLDVQIPRDGYDCSGLTWKAFKHHIMPLLGPELGSTSLKINIELPETDDFDGNLDGNIPSTTGILEEFNILHEYRCKELSVTMDGKPYNPAWAKSMTSKAPIFLLSDAYERLDDFVRSSTRLKLSGPARHALQGAMSAWDVQRFKNARQLALCEHKTQHQAEIDRHKYEISCCEKAIEVIEEESQSDI